MLQNRRAQWKKAPRVKLTPTANGEVPLERRGHAIFVTALLLVFASTLFPYDFFFRETTNSFADLFLLSRLSGRDIGANILLFLPFGFAFTGLIQEKQFRWLFRLALVLTVSAGLSFAVEILQVFLPSRTPSLLDVVANSLGAFLGCLCFRLGGVKILSCTAALGARSRRLLSTKILVAGFLGYAALACFLSARLQEATTLGNWNDSFPLLVGNEKTGDRPWEGRIIRVAMTNRFISPEIARRVSQNRFFSWVEDSFLVSYEFTDGDKYQDRAGHLAPLSWKGKFGQDASGAGIFLPRGSWLQTGEAATALVHKVKETNQFTLSVLCAPANTEQGGPARIVSLSADTLRRNFTFGQEGEDLVFRLRTPLTGENGTRPELVVPGIFETTGLRNLLFTYDGMELFLFVDGVRHPYSLALSPGAKLFRYLYRSGHTLDLKGFRLLYYVLVFVPLGCFLGLAAQRQNRWSSAKILLAGSAVLLPSLILETILVIVSGRPAHAENLISGILLVLGPAVALFFSRR